MKIFIMIMTFITFFENNMFSILVFWRCRRPRGWRQPGMKSCLSLDRLEQELYTYANET